MPLGGVIMWVQLLVGTALLKFGRAKDVKNLVQFRTTFDFTCNISGTHRDIDKQKMALLMTISPALNRKNLVNFGPLTKKSYRHAC